MLVKSSAVIVFGKFQSKHNCLIQIGSLTVPPLVTTDSPTKDTEKELLRCNDAANMEYSNGLNGLGVTKRQWGSMHGLQ